MEAGMKKIALTFFVLFSLSGLLYCAGSLGDYFTTGNCGNVISSSKGVSPENLSNCVNEIIDGINETRTKGAQVSDAINEIRKKLEPRWPLENPPLVAGSKSPGRQ
jgi:hypothetical protein